MSKFGLSSHFVYVEGARMRVQVWFVQGLRHVVYDEGEGEGEAFGYGQS